MFRVGLVLNVDMAKSQTCELENSPSNCAGAQVKQHHGAQTGCHVRILTFHIE